MVTRLRVGVGLLPVPLRNPALAAMEIATLARLFPGRLTVTLGHGVLDWMAQVGAAVESPMTLLREHTVAVRSLLAGETVPSRVATSTSTRSLSTGRPLVPPTLLIGGRGPRSVALAGEITDGVLLDSVVDPDVVRRARELVGPQARVVVYTEVADLAGVRDWIAELGAAGADTVVLQATEPALDPLLIDALALRLRPRANRSMRARRYDHLCRPRLLGRRLARRLPSLPARRPWRRLARPRRAGAARDGHRPRERPSASGLLAAYPRGDRRRLRRVTRSVGQPRQAAMSTR